MRIQAANGHARPGQLQITTRLRRQFDGQFNLCRREFLGNGFDGNMDRGQRHAQPASVFVLAEQHHRGPFGAGEFGEEFRLANEFVAGADDGFLVDGRGDQRIKFMAQAAFRAVAQPRHRGAGRRRRTRRQIFRQ